MKGIISAYFRWAGEVADGYDAGVAKVGMPVVIAIGVVVGGAIGFNMGGLGGLILGLVVGGPIIGWFVGWTLLGSQFVVSVVLHLLVPALVVIGLATGFVVAVSSLWGVGR